MIFYRHPVIYQQITMTPEEPTPVFEEDALVDDVPIVVRPDVFYSSVVKAEEIPAIDSGWDQTFNPPLVPARVIPPSSLVFVDEVAIIESGWVQDWGPHLVPARVIPPSSLVIGDEQEIIDSGFIQAPDNPPLFIFVARFVPVSSSTMSGLEEQEAPAVVVVRMRLLGGGLLKRKQLG